METENPLINLIVCGNVDAFYNSRTWRKLSKRVLKLQNYECQLCKTKGLVVKADCVHHRKTVKERPDLALSMYDENGQINLMALCADCHNEIHGRIFKAQEPLVPERW